MKRLFFGVFVGIVVVVIAWGQRQASTSSYLPYEVRSVFPRETTPAHYEQVDQRELQQLADQGWELVSVTPYVYRNEERGGTLPAPRPMVTQTYPAYFFKRIKR
jgi:hypothetical protein